MQHRLKKDGRYKGGGFYKKDKASFISAAKGIVNFQPHKLIGLDADTIKNDADASFDPKYSPKKQSKKLQVREESDYYVFFKFGKINFKMHKYNEALGFFEKALEKLDKMPDLNGDVGSKLMEKSEILARIARTQGLKNNAKSCFKKYAEALLCWSGNPRIYSYRAMTYIRSAEYEKAYADANESIRLGSDSYMGYYVKARACYGLAEQRGDANLIAEAIENALIAQGKNPSSKLVAELIKTIRVLQAPKESRQKSGASAGAPAQ